MQEQGRGEAVTAVAKAWARVRANLRLSAGARLFDQWLAPMTLVEDADADETAIRLALPSKFMADWVRNHYAERLVLEFREQLPTVRDVAIETRRAGPAVVVAQAEAAALTTAPQRARATTGLDARYTFARFVVDPSNAVACNAAQAMARPGAVPFSPLFLHGGTGQGKTHLMHAVGHAFLAASPDATVLIMSAERFMFDFVAAVRARDTFAFKAKLRGVDLLLIDDLHFIGGKDATQEEFFHTVNELTGAGKRVVISADRCPQSLDGMEPRIVARLASGMVADIRASTLPLRRAVLDAKLAELPDARVPGAVLDLLAARITTSIRELEGALGRVIAYAHLSGEAIDLEFATRVLGEMLRGRQRRVTIDEIQKLVCGHFDLSAIDLVSARRARAVARPRQIAMYLAKRMTTRSLPEIGRKFGGRDHSTVIHAVRRIEELRESDREIDVTVRALMERLEA